MEYKNTIRRILGPVAPNGRRRLIPTAIRYAAKASYIHRRLAYHSHTVVGRLINASAISDCETLVPRPEFHNENYNYGLGSVLRDYMGVKKPLDAVIEHGLVMHAHVPSWMYQLKRQFVHLPIWTISPWRAEMLRQRGFEATAIGPYIQYVWPESGPNVRNENPTSRTLLFFPYHSMEGAIGEYDLDEAIASVLSLAGDYDRVVVCMYWYDAFALRHHVKYQAAGFHCVCAGLREDPCFLRRLSAIIDASDAIVSNNTGTHTAYALAQGKPYREITQMTRKRVVSETENDFSWLDVPVEMLTVRGHMSERWVDPRESARDPLFRRFLGAGISLSPRELRLQYKRGSE